jgi:hypothetical protein
MPDANASFGISVSAQASSTAQVIVCAQIGGANAQTRSTSRRSDYRVDSRFPTSTLRLPGYTGAAQNLTAVRNLVVANNGTAAAEVSASTGLGTRGTLTTRLAERRVQRRLKPSPTAQLRRQRRKPGRRRGRDRLEKNGRKYQRLIRSWRDQSHELRHPV